ncbi:hypothetical protein L6164_031225 [Bauhinia variegata]|uniref:Uncharacterized protein n=1 Tax=Bauhinia variegata TaxID=167791 RepID=A0ACB9LEC3_BAUVA|nr:hypothetical protein L6164_031225 [Bauhinia variegata]
MEKNDMDLVDLEELEILEIDAALLRDLLEEEYEDDNGVKECMEVDEDKSIMIDKKEEKQQPSCLEQYEWHVHDFEWQNMMDMEMQTLSPNDAMVDWYPDDIVGMADFDYVLSNI